MNNEEKIMQMLTGLTEVVSNLSSGQAEMRAEMEARFSKLEATQTKQGEQLSRLEEKVARLEATQTRQGEQLSRLEEKVNGLEEKFARMEATQTKQGEQLSRLEEKVARLEVTQTKQGEQLSRLEEQVKKLDARSLKSAVLLETDIPHQLGLLYEGHKTILETLASTERVEKLEEEVTILKGSVQALASRLSVLEKAQ